MDDDQTTNRRMDSDGRAANDDLFELDSPRFRPRLRDRRVERRTARRAARELVKLAANPRFVRRDDYDEDEAS